jgi:uncharacterized protein (DUF1800 family)
MALTMHLTIPAGKQLGIAAMPTHTALVRHSKASSAAWIPTALMLLLITFSLLSGCSGGSGGATEPTESATPIINAQEGATGPTSSVATLKSAPLAPEAQPSVIDAARFLSQTSFGPVSVEEVDQVRQVGFEKWMDHQFSLSAKSHLAYVSAQAPREKNGKPTDEMSYEALWQQWLFGEDQLRGRVAFALSQIFVISNVAPDLNPQAMSSYVDMLNGQAFGNYRQLLEAVTLHPAMGYYLNMVESEKEDPAKGTHPNENFAREVLQLFSIGLVKLNIDGTPIKDVDGKTTPTYDEDVVKGFAKAFSGWSFGGRDTTKPDTFHNGEENWTVPMQAWASRHSTAAKKLLDGVTIPAGQTPQQDLQQALDAIANHPNVAPFISRRLIQRLVTSNPSPAYIQRVASIFNNNGAGVRGDLKAVVRTILLDKEARDSAAAMATDQVGKQREPVIRFANLLRAMRAKSTSGHTSIWYLDSADSALGQSPLLAPSVFNFFSPDFRAPGAIAAAGLYSPEFQMTTDTTVVGSINFFASVIRDGGFKGWGAEEHRIKLDFAAWDVIAADAGTMIDYINLLFMNNSMRPETRTSFMRAINSIDQKLRADRIKMALSLAVIAPEFVIQR